MSNLSQMCINCMGKSKMTWILLRVSHPKINLILIMIYTSKKKLSKISMISDDVINTIFNDM